MLEKIRRKLSEAMDALAGGAPVSREELDRVLGRMREELIEARARPKGREEAFRDVEADVLLEQLERSMETDPEEET